MSKRTIILILCGALLIAAAFVSLIIELKPKTGPEEVIEPEDVIEPEEIIPLRSEYLKEVKLRSEKVVKDNNLKVTPTNESGNEKET